MVNNILLWLAKKLISKITDAEMLVELSKWILDSVLPVDYLVMMKINDKVNYQNLRSDPSYKIRRIQALRHPEIARILISAGLVSERDICSDSKGNLRATVSLSFAIKWIEENYE